ncbi:MAG: 3-oxoacyl-[acyl-carrier-protein] synthase III C-terminal domain-containing protein [Verrucomicrobiota bacterium JB023]|nr:3-oxoacyl-[acyl-carrier-protein] synthase III C-terminal domain-containing protein [Verrucomicrobiota bacterium JB023]
MMILEGLASAVPEHSFRQAEVWERVGEGGMMAHLNPRSHKLMEKVLKGESGIEERRFVLPDIERLFSMDAQELNEAYEQAAPALAAQALATALEKAELQAVELDALLVCSCTGYLCPGLSSHVGELAGVRGDAFLQDVTGFGCGAALPMWRVAEGFLAANPGAKVATVAVEICSLAFFLNDEPGVLLSACLFGDGAAAAVWSDEAREGAWRAGQFQTVHLPEERERIRFVNEKGFLKNQLCRTVPVLAGEAVEGLWNKRTREPGAVIAHGGGRDVIEELERRLGLSLAASREVMRKFGNCSSPSVMMALEAYLNDSPAEDALWLTSFGAGFAAHSAELQKN